MANTMMQKFWDSALALEPPDDSDTQSEMSAMMHHSDIRKLASYPSLGLGNSFSFKFEDLKGRVHRFTSAAENLEELMCIVMQRIGSDNTNPEQRPQIIYEDDEGDKVLITSDSDLVGAVTLARSTGQKVLRLHLDFTETKGSKRRDKGLFKSESSTKSTDYSGMWQVPRNPDNCCIYRVPNRMRRVNPEAYTPQLLLIGPLHLSLKSQALKSQSRGDITDTKMMGYLSMEAHKRFYLAEFAKRVDGKDTIDGFKKIIKENEKKIRESYSESTAWIESSEFVEMILHDSIFIIEFVLRMYPNDSFTERPWDPLMVDPCLALTVKGDLGLLENQLPYFILEKLFDPVVPVLPPNKRLREMIVEHFEYTVIRNDTEFKHFTDLSRCVRVETLPDFALKGFRKHIDHMYNMEKLNSGGVKFEAVQNKLSLCVSFDNGCLKIPCFTVYEELEMSLRNIMALEQCHYPFSAHVCNYIIFLDHLIDTDKDVNLLAEKGIIVNPIGEHRSVAEMVNKLCLGVSGFFGSYYSMIAADVNKYYKNRWNRACAVLKSVYFGDLWTGTGTVAAAFLLLMTLIQTVASIIQVMQNAKSPK